VGYIPHTSPVEERKNGEEFGMKQHTVKESKNAREIGIQFCFRFLRGATELLTNTKTIREKKIRFYSSISQMMEKNGKNAQKKKSELKNRKFSFIYFTEWKIQKGSFSVYTKRTKNV